MLRYRNHIGETDHEVRQADHQVVEDLVQPVRLTSEVASAQAGVTFSNVTQTAPTGCRHCLAGAKAQIHLTFRCDLDCGFCPIPADKFGRDVMELAGAEIDPTQVERIVAVLAGRPDLCGAAISGGEPTLYPARLLDLIQALRHARGPHFHLHLYTNGVNVKRPLLERLVAAGIDEFRINNLSARTFAKFSNLAADVVCEVPCLPRPATVTRILRLVEALPALGIHRVNLNEVEATLENLAWLKAQGFHLNGSRIDGCDAAAAAIIEHGRRHGVSVFYCNHDTAERIRVARNRPSAEDNRCQPPIDA